MRENCELKESSIYCMSLDMDGVVVDVVVEVDVEVVVDAVVVVDVVKVILFVAVVVDKVVIGVESEEGSIKF
ncbi:hypothetical protein BpHYR1_049247 [Brachionus plicatilis]|uniref:Uncharacterized protein n=1 Tax=Brachionus plicatilis TaxID=10195 RepID=A0A3M7QP50_BRAPC|nr:hypothetical protein BpHYR1_049247 [Brachionus plicatilis]